MRKNMNVKGKKITILGAARSGIAAAKLLQSLGADVWVSDSALPEKKTQAIRELEEAGIAAEFGEHSPLAFDADFVVLSPGIPVASTLVQKFLKAGTPVYSEVEVAAWFNKSRLIAVTGSNGKTTTTTLIGLMLRRNRSDAIVAGNIGQPFSAFVKDSSKKSWTVLELSSFQLETIEHLKPDVALILNFAPNHLNRYASYQAYQDAKWRITMNLDENNLLILNADDGALMERGTGVRCKKETFSVKTKEAGAYFADGHLYLHDKELIDVHEMALAGVHNYMDALAASLAAHYAGVSFEAIRDVLKTFSGVEHRLEFVTEIDGVRYVNDSKATTLESLFYALQSFENPIVLIAGGQDKGSDFTRLTELIRSHTRAIVLIGSATEKMAVEWADTVPLFKAGSLRQAVQMATEQAQKDDVVLLSPACASFDMFSDYEERGRQFKSIVNELKEKKDD